MKRTPIIALAIICIGCKGGDKAPPKMEKSISEFVASKVSDPKPEEKVQEEKPPEAVKTKLPPPKLGPSQELIALYNATRNTEPCKQERVCPDEALKCTCYESGNLATVELDANKDGSYEIIDFYDEKDRKIGEAFARYDEPGKMGRLVLFSHDEKDNIAQKFVDNNADGVWDERATYTYNEQGHRLTNVEQSIWNGMLATGCFDYVQPCNPPYNKCSQVVSTSGSPCQNTGEK